MAKAKWSRVELRKLEVFATALVETCVRDSQLEQLHAGITPDSQTGDLSDVKVVSPYGEIPWTDVSRISDDETGRSRPVNSCTRAAGGGS